MKLDELRKSIQKRNIAGECYQSISISLGISKAMAHQIANGHRPGPEVSAILGLEPSAKILRDRARRKAQRDEAIELHKENDRLKTKINQWLGWYSKIQDAAGCDGFSLDETIDIIRTTRMDRDTLRFVEKSKL